MSDFKDFVRSKKTKGITADHTKKLSTGIEKVLATSSMTIANSDRQKFAEEAINVAQSDEVLSELSDQIGKPAELESEDEFVNRSKKALSKILKEKLNG